MTQATYMCVQQRRHGACMGALCLLGGRIGAHREEGAAQIPGGSALTGGRALRRNLHNTQVSGDVSGWKAMTQATYMCVQQRRHGACMGALCLLGGRIGAHREEGAAQIPGGSALTGGRALRRNLHNTQVSGDVSGWKAMTQARYMCVQQRRHGACMGALYLLGGRIGAHREEGAAQTPVQYPGERRRLGLEGNDPG